MYDKDETKNLIDFFSDKSRKVAQLGRQFLVPHKFKESGEVVSQENYQAKNDLSRLTLHDFRFLAAWRSCGWDAEKAAEKTGLDPETARKLAKKLEYFPFEEAQAKALAAIPDTNWITSKHVENVYQGGKLNDSERDSLKELSKIRGSYKTTAAISLTQNVFNLPQLSPDVEAKFKALAEEALDAEIVPEPHAA